MLGAARAELHRRADVGLERRQFRLEKRGVLTPDQRALVKRAIESGRFSHEEEAVQEALALWEERERRRLEILASLDEPEASLAQSEGRPITEESMKALAEDVKQRGRARLAAERNASH